MTTVELAPNKVEVLLKPVGDAPMLNKKKWSVDRDKTIAWIVQFIRTYIKLDVSDSLFLYVNQCFAPSLDQTIGNLFDCFASDGKLVLHYAKTKAWG